MPKLILLSFTILFLCIQSSALLSQEAPSEEQIATWKTEADQFAQQAAAQKKLMAEKQDQILTTQRELNRT